MKKQNVFELRLDGDYLTVSSCFDSGNLARVDVIDSWQLRLEPLVDNPEDAQSCQKTYFHFSVAGVTAGKTVRFLLRGISQLRSLPPDLYRPYFRELGMTEYQRLPGAVSLTSGGDLAFQHSFGWGQTFFSYGEPYPYLRYSGLVAQLKQNVHCLVRLLALSLEKRPVHLVAITERPPPCDDSLQSLLRLVKGLPGKAVILITARVHAGQSPSSFLAESLMLYLVSDDERAALLRRYFLFLFVPMLNPDGVHNGNYRFDCAGQNLNRCYKNPNPKKQPTIHAVKRLMEELEASSNPPLFFFDLHAHASTKGFFLYGNAIDTFSVHVENVLFARLLNECDPNLEHAYSNFSKKEMKQEKTTQSQSNKDGCARVAAYRMFNVAHSYTVELGFHSTAALRSQGALLGREHYARFGTNMLSSVLDLFGHNPQPGLKQSLAFLREEVMRFVVYSEERFKIMEKSGILKKMTSDFSKNYYLKKLKGKAILERTPAPSPKKLTRKSIFGRKFKISAEDQRDSGGKEDLRRNVSVADLELRLKDSFKGERLGQYVQRGPGTGLALRVHWNKFNSRQKSQLVFGERRGVLPDIARE